MTFINLSEIIIGFIRTTWPISTKPVGKLSEKAIENEGLGFFSSGNKKNI